MPPRDSQQQQQPFGPLTAFARHVLLATCVVLGVVLLLIALWYAANALLVAFAGVLVAILLRAPADWLAARTRLSQRWSLAVVLVALLAAMVGVGFLVAPQISEQGQQLTRQLPESLEQLRHFLDQTAAGRWLVDLVPAPEDLDVAGLLLQATGVANAALAVLAGFVILLFVAIYLAVDPRQYSNGLLRLVPIAQRPRAALVLAATGFTLRWCLIGTLIRMTAVGLMTFAGLWLLGVPLALVLAVLAFLLDFVPYFGPIIAAVPAVLLALMDGPQQALYVMLLYFAVQQAESLLLSPLIYQRTVYLPPVLTILVQIVLFAMFGALGILLATPLAAAGMVWVKMLYVEQILGDRVDTPDEQLDPHDIPPIPGDNGEPEPAGRQPPAREDQRGACGTIT